MKVLTPTQNPKGQHKKKKTQDLFSHLCFLIFTPNSTHSDFVQMQQQWNQENRTRVRKSEA